MASINAVSLYQLLDTVNICMPEYNHYINYWTISRTATPNGCSQSILSLLKRTSHYSDVIIGAMASQLTSLTIVYSTVYSGADQRKHQSSASLAIVQGIHRWPVNSPHKWPVTRKIFPFDDVIISPGYACSGHNTCHQMCIRFRREAL